MDRREFLKQSAIAATALSASPRTLFGASHDAVAQQKTVAAVDGGAVRQFASRLRGQALSPGDAGYEAASRIWTGAIPKRPGLVVLPAGTDDIAAAVRFSREQGLALAVRGGGHTLHSTTEGGVLLNLASLKKVAVDPAKRLLRADAGLTGGEVDKATSAHGLATVMGECPSVGISGLTLGGGLGRLMGQHGALCDNLLAAEVVTAEGAVLRVSANENADLFWAIRGGGGNFGIVTSLEYRLHPVGQVLSGVLQYPISRVRETLQFFGRYMETAPEPLDAVMEIGTGFLLYVDPRNPAIAIHVTCGGDLRAAERALQPLRAFGPPSSDTIRAVSYFEAQAMGNFAPAVMPFPKGLAGYVRRGFVTRLTDDAVDRIVAALEKPPSTHWHLALDHYMHGEVLRVREGVCLSGELEPVCPVMPSRVAARSTEPPQGPFPPAALFVAAIDSTTIPSDSRCAPLDFAFGLYEPVCPDTGRTDGPLVFHTAPCTRAAPHTPPRPSAPVAPEARALDVAFAAT